jgi:hypothetical protein
MFVTEVQSRHGHATGRRYKSEKNAVRYGFWQALVQITYPAPLVSLYDNVEILTTILYEVSDDESKSELFRVRGTKSEIQEKAYAMIERMRRRYK